MKTNVKPIPEGYRTITPYLTVEGLPKLMDFLKRAFGAEEKFAIKRPDGTIGHAEMKIGDSMVMMGEARDQWKARPANIYMYVEDCDALYRRALDAGAKSQMEPQNHFYGDRSCGVEDPCGNYWWIGTHIEDVSEEDMVKRMQQASS